MRFVGIQVNDTTSKDSRIATLGMVCDLMNPTKVPNKFLTWELVKPTTGASRPARNFESSWGRTRMTQWVEVGHLAYVL